MMDRRSVLRGVLPLALLPYTDTLASSGPFAAARSEDRSWGKPDGWRSHFPALAQKVNGQPIAYLDTAATAQRPAAVIDAVADFYRRDNANPARTLHTLARRADDDYEDARRTVARFIYAADPLEIVFTRGTTEAINLVASSWGTANLRAGDDVLLTVAEHASNLLPWQLAAQRAGATVHYLDVDDEGRIDLEHLQQRLTSRTKVLAFMHVSNVLGLINPAKEICARARAAGAMVMIDGAQSVPHFKVDVQELGCDFLAFSSHKMMGPMGTGVLWGRRELLDAMPPYQAGSNMAHDVDLDGRDYAAGALKFGAGTPNVSGPVGLAAAIRFIERIGMAAMWEHEQSLTRHTLTRLRDVRGLQLIGAASAVDRIAVFSFVLDCVAPPDLVKALDAKGIAIRAGDLAALPLLKRFGVTRAARASLYLYTTMEEVDRLADALSEIAKQRSC